MESFTYNTRLAATHYEIPAGGGLTTASSVDYQYYDDGRLKYSHNSLESRLDRRYEYDHLGRLVKGLSGAEARGEPATNDRPYNETATYDAFNHLNLRYSQHWSRRHEFSSADTYSNNRRVGWTYDADGNWLSGAGRQYTYDAAGRTSSTIWSTGANFSELYDGDGERVKATDLYGVTYYLRSTVLGGRVVEELNGSGGKQHSLIYAWGRVIGHVWANGNVSLMHTDPAGVSITSSAPQSPSVGYFSELDPWGAEVFSEDPYLVDPDFSGGRGASPPTYSGYGDISMSSTGCMLDGVYTLCRFLDNTESLALQVTVGGHSKQYPITTSALGLATVWVEDQGKRLLKKQTPADAEVSEDDIIVTNTDSDGLGHLEFVTVDFSRQNTQTPLSPKHIYSIYRGLKDIGRYFPLCNNFIKETLEKLTELNPNNPPVSTDIVQIFRAIQNQPDGGFFISDAGFSTVSGIIKEGNAKILYLSSPFIYVSRTVHEGFHISGTNGWLYDRAVAEAISRVDQRYLKAYEDIDPKGKGAYGSYSSLIDNALSENCPDSLFER